MCTFDGHPRGVLNIYFWWPSMGCSPLCAFDCHPGVFSICDFDCHPGVFSICDFDCHPWVFSIYAFDCHPWGVLNM